MVEDRNPETFISVLIVIERFSQNRDVSHVTREDREDREGREDLVSIRTTLKNIYIYIYDIHRHRAGENLEVIRILLRDSCFMFVPRHEGMRHESYS
jgi:hypothetical protein